MSILAPSFFMYVGVYIVSFFLALCYEDWFLVWGGLEVNMMSFLGMCYCRGSSESPESLYKYFFVQSLASGLFLMIIVVGGLVSLALMVKLAAGPFFFWLPVVMEGLGWLFNFMLMTVQSLLPLILVEGLGGKEVMYFGLISLFVGVVGSMNQSDLRSLMAYSSVNHVGWILLSQLFIVEVWLDYFFLYMVMLVLLVFFFWFSGLVKMGDGGSWDMFVMFILMMNIGGMPPMLGFVMKWMIFQLVVGMNYIIGFAMVVSSLGMLYVYLRAFYEGMLGGGKWLVWIKGTVTVNIMVMVSVMVSFFFPFIMWML